ncbi:SAM-dependent methyltransferase [Streptomyces sp. AV19]|uniref:SAM-dependent methyltransferase n=1 Tax=Streptomyces sp. AV19 TaxID=2793068 RepID=UPI0018FF0AE2|nr:SAM-dependent methyltransferase [Streptomyces sp. AV19]MBH1938837.1 SAM-dependent methyltransferase [Streptomyces sp. AV19]MDG4534771.1 SAM-dependent methyltransferase [Streptomyces sp. AV19]
MVHSEKQKAPRIDVNTPSAARMYDWLLGGIDNYLPDREACAELLEIAPSSQALARSNRAFLRRVVAVLVEQYGVEQIIDHGSGLPTRDNVHQVAQRINKNCRVVYVDNDPLVLAHGRTSLEENSNTAVIQADMRDTGVIFDHEETRRLIRPGHRTAALFVSVLHCLPDTDDDRSPAALIRRVAGVLRELGPGNFLVMCQLISDNPDVRRKVTQLMARKTGDKWGRVRERDEVEAYFRGLQVLEPGLVDVVDWRPDVAPPPAALRPTDWVEWGGLAQL